MEDVLKERVTKHFGIISDGWTETNIHYLAVFSTYLKDVDSNEHLIACCLFNEEKDFSATQHVPFFTKTLELYDKDMSIVSCFIWDNCSVRQKVPSISYIPLSVAVVISSFSPSKNGYRRKAF